MKKTCFNIIFIMLVIMFCFSLSACGKADSSFSVSFYTENGTLIETTNNNKDDFIQLLSTPITKEGNVVYEYEFAGWYTEEVGGKKVTSASDVESDTELYPRFNEILKRYSVKYYDAYDEVIFTENVAYGSPSSFLGEIPEKLSSLQYLYTFVGWDKSTEEILEDTSVYPIYSETICSYTITFLDDDEKLLKQVDMEFGQTPTYEVDPVKPNTDKYTYTFSGWDKPITVVVGPSTYKATYSTAINQVLVKFMVDGNLYKSFAVDYEGALTDIPIVPTIEGYTAEWDTTSFNRITEELVVTAVYELIKYDVSFVSNDATGILPDTLFLTKDSIFVMPECNMSRFGYVFDGWLYNGTKYSAGEQVTVNNENSNAVAQWSELCVTVYRNVSYEYNNVNEYNLYLFENGAFYAITTTYLAENGSLTTKGSYSITVVEGSYIIVSEVFSVIINNSYTYSYNYGTGSSMSYLQYITESVFLRGLVTEEALLINARIYSKVYENILISSLNQNNGSVIGIIFNTSFTIVENEKFTPTFACVFYKDLSIKFVPLSEVYIQDVDTSYSGTRRSIVKYEDYSFEFLLTVITNEQKEIVIDEIILGDIIYFVGDEYRAINYQKYYYGYYKTEAEAVPLENISNFDTSVKGIKHLSILVDGKTMYFDIYVLEDNDDEISWFEYYDSDISSARQNNLNVFEVGQTISTLYLSNCKNTVNYNTFLTSKIEAQCGFIPVDVSSITLSTDSEGIFECQIVYEGNEYVIEYAVVNSTDFNTVTSRQLFVESEKVQVGDIVDFYLLVTYGDGTRVECVNVNSDENAEIVGFDTLTSGIKTVELYYDSVLIQTINMYVFSPELDELIEYAYFDTEILDNTINIFAEGSIITHLSVKTATTNHLYGSEDSISYSYSQIEISDIDSSTIGEFYKQIEINGKTVNIEYRIVDENAITTVTNFEVLGDKIYLVNEVPNLSLKIEYCDGIYNQIIEVNESYLTYDNSSAGRNIATLTYNEYRIKFNLYFFETTFDFMEYDYYQNADVCGYGIDFKNVFLQNSDVTEIILNKYSVKLFYDGKQSTTSPTEINYSLAQSIDTIEAGSHTITLETSNGNVVYNYIVVSQEDYNDLKFDRVVGRKVYAKNEELDLYISLRYGSSNAYKLVKVDNLDITEYNPSLANEQIVLINYGGKTIYFNIFVYSSEEQTFSELIALDTSLIDFDNYIEIGQQNELFEICSKEVTYNYLGEIIDVKTVTNNAVYCEISNNKEVGEYTIDVVVFGYNITIEYRVIEKEE